MLDRYFEHERTIGSRSKWIADALHGREDSLNRLSNVRNCFVHRLALTHAPWERGDISELALIVFVVNENDLKLHFVMVPAVTSQTSRRTTR